MARAYPSIYEAYQHTRNLNEQIAATLSAKYDRDFDDLGVAVVGSFGRLEASRESDFDFFVLAENPNERAESVANDVRQLIIEKGIKPPSKGGAFSTVQGSDSMVTQIGGDQDDNQSITRRILFLLEAQTLLNKKFTASVLEAIIGRYIKEKITDHQLALFFLNDVIRYYRTVCVDFEFKTSNLNKEWGLRNIKLVFSRK